MKAQMRLSELLAGLREMGQRQAAAVATLQTASTAAARTLPVAGTTGPGGAVSANGVPVGVNAVGREQTLDALAELLREFAGFRPTPHLQRKLDQALRHLDAQGLAQLINTLRADNARRDLQSMVEDITNHETYFFRDPQQLDVLANPLLPALIREKNRRGDRNLRIWSAACATGEEAWTLAMLALQALLDANCACETRSGDVELLNGWRLEVLGTDISRPALRVARDGSYSDNVLASFRQFPHAYLRFFYEGARTTPRYRRVNDCLRRHVTFESFNLVGNAPPRLNCDLVLCRNVLIYLDPTAQPGIQQTLHDALRPGGLLMLGVVDRLWQREHFNEHWYGRTVIHERR